MLWVLAISPILFEIRIPNLVIWCVEHLGMAKVKYYFRVTVNVTFDLVSRIIVSGVYLGMAKCRILFWVMLTLILIFFDRISKIIISGA